MQSDYDRIASAIKYIQANAQKQPSLLELARHVHLSEYHFQRLFSEWAGVTPKRYLQALTLERAKELLKGSSISSLDACYELGLSSRSRLYDHFVHIEAVTPSEFKQQGKGLVISFGVASTPYGWAFVANTKRGVCCLEFLDSESHDTVLKKLKWQWPNAEFFENPPQAERITNQIFVESKARPKPLSLWVHGTNFQLNVWRALLKLKEGTLASYGDIANAIGKPKATRAVGSAIGANPIALVIPCHRVLRQTGALGGYRWGEVRKQAILARELARGSWNN